VLELAACDPATGACRVVVRDGWPTGWVENNPEMRFLADGRRFIRLSERTGWKNYYLHDLDGSLLRPLTNHAFEVAGIVHVDEKAGILYYRPAAATIHEGPAPPRRADGSWTDV
jgi:dipeptidyl-peptidase-4